jgi:hypothetical protein
MKIRQKLVDGSDLVVQYIYGNTNPYVGSAIIKASSNSEATALSALADEQLIERVQQELGEQMLADLQATYG